MEHDDVNTVYLAEVEKVCLEGVRRGSSIYSFRPCLI